MERAGTTRLPNLYAELVMHLVGMQGTNPFVHELMNMLPLSLRQTLDAMCRDMLQPTQSEYSHFLSFFWTGMSTMVHPLITVIASLPQELHYIGNNMLIASLIAVSKAITSTS